MATKPYDSNTRFLHFRAYDTETEVSSHGGATIAYVEGEEGITYGAAYCHDLDRYIKERGRIKAAGRMRSVNFSHVAPHVTRDEFIATLDKEMAQQHLFRTRRAR